MNKLLPITWSNGQRKLSDLIPWDINPATIDKKSAARLEESLEEFGQVEPIAISPDNEIYDGHQRQTVWSASAKFGPDYLVDVRISSRKLTECERKKLVIYLRKGAVGRFDMDILANNWEVPDLIEWGFEPFELGIVPNIPFDEYNGEGDGGGSRIQDGTKVRVVIGALMFDIEDKDHSLYAITKGAGVDAARDSILAFITEGGLS
jgi:hypothetical protein